MSDSITITLSEAERHTLVFALNRAVREYREEHERTNNVRAAIHADKIEKVRVSIVNQTMPQLKGSVSC